MYADDVKIVKTVKNDDDCMTLQAVQNGFPVWAMRMGLKLSVNKCGVLRIGLETPSSRYRIGIEVLPELSESRDLGVIISPSLKFSEHVRRLYQSHIVPILTYIAAQLLEPYEYRRRRLA